MTRTTTLVYSLIATAMIWATVLMVRLIGGPEIGILDFALFAGLGSTVAIWLVWVFASIDEASKSGAREAKAKRAAAEEDARLSLLLQLMDEDERSRLKERLREDLGADGEAVALDDLLDRGERARRR
ncbi:MAG TPA: hypothetical protein PKD46_16660 [Aggregatilineaceae bacterium]|nr:hypothetical protein [Aggregatilineaceae bacterium]